MKKNVLKYTLAGLFTLAFATACTDDFERLNTSNHVATADDMEKDGKAVGSYFKDMIDHITVMTIGAQDDGFASTGAYQHQIGLAIDSYSGYIGHTANWCDDNYTGNYSFARGGEWGNAMFKMGMVKIMPNWAQMTANAEKLNLPQEKAMGDIVKVFGMHRVADCYGPLPYVNYTLGSVDASYDAQDKIYAKFFEELDNAIDVLTPLAEGGAVKLAEFDPIYEGDVTKWVKFANTLRLRLALRVVYADAALAKTEAEKSSANPVGFIETADGRCQYNKTQMNPIYEQAYSWNENRMSAAMDSYLNGYNDPRISKFFKTAGDGKYHGVRPGIFATGSSKTEYQGEKISNVNLSANTPVLYMAAAEAYFLRAEGALRGWSMGGTAKEFYEAGVKLSMEENDASGYDAYIADNTSTPAAFVDNVGSDNASAPSTITIAWDDAASFETNLERIITQKWIAGWGNSCEAWAEYRRTGYPKLFPVKRNMSQGTINTDLQIRRLPYPETEYDTNRAAVTAAALLLGGADNGGTKLWWDKKAH